MVGVAKGVDDEGETLEEEALGNGEARALPRKPARARPVSFIVCDGSLVWIRFKS